MQFMMFEFPPRVEIAGLVQGLVFTPLKEQDPKVLWYPISLDYRVHYKPYTQG